MERMGDILARSARMRARRAKPGAAPPPTQPASDVAQPAVPDADTLDAERILELPVRRASGVRALASVAQMAAAPRDDAGQQGAGAARTTREPATPPNQRARVGAARPAAASRMRAGSSGMLSLGEATQGYAAALRSARPTGQASKRGSGATRRAADADVCPECHGAGYVRLDVPVGDPAFGQAVACACKERLLEERRLSDLRRMSSLDAVRDKTFATFDVALPGVREALEVARRYAEDPDGWLVLSGGYGVGKTHLAAAIAHERLASGQSVFFSIVPDLLDHLRAAFAPSSEMPYDELFDKVREAGLLVLDDLGAENATAWATEKLFQIINYRYNYRMPTVITTNNRLLSHMDERIRSRLSDRSFVRNVSIEAADYRERHAGRPRQTRQASQTGQGGAPRNPRGSYQR